MASPSLLFFSYILIIFWGGKMYSLQLYMMCAFADAANAPGHVPLFHNYITVY